MSLLFAAPWSRFLTGFTLVLIGGTVWAVLSAPVLVALLLVGLMLAAGALSVRGYAVEPGVVRVLRPGWSLDLDLRGLESVDVDPNAMRRAWRVFGMGGLFALVGWFRSRAVGPFRAYATDPKRSVVLRWADRTVVVTPDDPEAFATAIKAAAERF